MKICHGVKEIAGQGFYSVYGLKAIGQDAKELLWQNNFFNYDPERRYSKVYNIRTEKKHIFKTIINLMSLFKDAIKYDCFHFHFAQSLLPYNIDLPILKLLKKKMYFEFHGSELRGAFNDIDYEYYDPTNSSKDVIQKRILKCLKYADGVILHDQELVPHLPNNYKGKVHIVPLRMDLDKFKLEPSKMIDNKKAIVVHAPSRRATKGTDMILRELEKLSDIIELRLVENCTQQEALKIYNEADIIIDQIAIGTYGVFSIEAMALGKPVLSYISDDMRNTFPSDLPIINITPDNLCERVKYLVDNPLERDRIGKAGINYVAKNHDCKIIAKKLLDVYLN